LEAFEAFAVVGVLGLLPAKLPVVGPGQDVIDGAVGGENEQGE
jgi:hypothetical protein